MLFLKVAALLLASTSAQAIYFTAPQRGTVWNSPQNQEITWKLQPGNPPRGNIVLIGINQNPKAPQRSAVLAPGIDLSLERYVTTQGPRDLPRFGTTTFRLVIVNPENDSDIYAALEPFTIESGPIEPPVSSSASDSITTRITTTSTTTAITTRLSSTRTTNPPVSTTAPPLPVTTQTTTTREIPTTTSRAPSTTTAAPPPPSSTTTTEEPVPSSSSSAEEVTTTSVTTTTEDPLVTTIRSTASLVTITSVSSDPANGAVTVTATRTAQGVQGTSAQNQSGNGGTSAAGKVSSAGVGLLLATTALVGSLAML